MCPHKHRFIIIILCNSLLIQMGKMRSYKNTTYTLTYIVISIVFCISLHVSGYCLLYFNLRLKISFRVSWSAGLLETNTWLLFIIKCMNFSSIFEILPSIEFLVDNCLTILVDNFFYQETEYVYPTSFWPPYFPIRNKLLLYCRYFIYEELFLF